MDFGNLVGVTLGSVQVGSESVTFLEQGFPFRAWKLAHEQQCCESVYVEDVIGNVADLEGSPILMAEVVTEDPDDFEEWTFYKLATAKGYVTIRWCGINGESGYYSLAVDFYDAAVHHTVTPPSYELVTVTRNEAELLTAYNPSQVDIEQWIGEHVSDGTLQTGDIVHTSYFRKMQDANIHQTIAVEVERTGSDEEFEKGSWKVTYLSGNYAGDSYEYHID